MSLNKQQLTREQILHYSSGNNMASGSKEGERKSRRLSGEEVLDIDSSFPMCERFQPPGKLPTLRSVLGRMRLICRVGKGLERPPGLKVAADKVAKEVFCKYYHDNICCLTIGGISYRIKQEYEALKKGEHRLSQGREEHKEVIQLKEQLLRKDQIFPAFLDPDKEGDKDKIKKCEEDWGVKMAEMEYKYLQDQRSERKMECDNGVDPVWFRAVMRRHRMRERLDLEYVRQRREDYRWKNLKQIDDFMESTGELPISSSEASVESHEKPAVKEGGQRKRKRGEYEEEDDEKEDELPERYKHIRISERKVREEVYQTFADLSG